MKIKFLLFSSVVLLFTACAQKTEKPEAEVVSKDTPISVSEKLPIAYINLDTLLQRYNYAKDLNESLLRRQENARSNINEKGSTLEKEAAEFQRKVENNAFLSRERAEQEQQRLMKKQQELGEMSQRFERELMMEQQKMMLQMDDSIKNIIKVINVDDKYHVILSNASVLFINSSYDITQEVVSLLNKRYNPSSKK